MATSSSHEKDFKPGFDGESQSARREFKSVPGKPFTLVEVLVVIAVMAEFLRPRFSACKNPQRAPEPGENRNRVSEKPI